MSFKPVALFYSCLFLILACIALVRYGSWEFSYIPDERRIANPGDPEQSRAGMSAWETERPELEPTDAMIRFGREAFYSETFGNETLFSDIIGVFDSAVTIPGMVQAIAELRGEGTTNLRVKAAKTVNVGGRTIRQGDFIDTGLDVARGTHWPLGIKLVRKEGRLKAGVSCIMCHAIADPGSGKVIEGPPNPDIQAGLLLALGTNSSAFFTHTNIDTKLLRSFVSDPARTVETSDGRREPLPDPALLEEAVDRALLQWPPGSVDTMIDLQNNPSQIPDSFTLGDHPYGWNGTAQSGPYHGLVFLNGLPNGQNMDPLVQADLSGKLFGIDKETYLATLMQNAANPKYRYRVGSGERPSDFFRRVDPTPGAPGLNTLVPTPDSPRSSFVSLVGTIASKPGYRIHEHNIAMAAYQNTLKPPATGLPRNDAAFARGRGVFRRAACISCHAGDTFTNHRVVPLSVIGTEPTRAQALRKAGENWGHNVTYDWATRVPLPESPKLLQIPVPDSENARIALMQGGSEGGYKVPGLFGLYWSAPYLHDGGVAAGRRLQDEQGLPGTLYRGIPAEPANSLRALLDRGLRERVVRANLGSAEARGAHLTGQGHPFWVDEQAGFTSEDQDALIHYLLRLTD
ncbi:electron transport protein [Paenibacillus chartarius]|uniref:Electron transport protein n=1 Tax=Paenibacillus chartarius TaxID=747481 RepID=A0ABV6DIU6_9BACL